MLNQAVLEAMYYVPYMETYLDVVENLPDEIQRYLTKIRELDVCYHAYMKEIEAIAAQTATSEDPSAFRKRNLSRVQVALIAAQEIGDEKLAILQQIQDVIENKTRQLDGIFCDLPFTKTEAKKDVETTETNGKTDETKKSSGDTVSEPTEAPKKRTRRKRAEIEAAAEPVEHTAATPLPRSSATIEVNKKSSTAETPVKKRKRKSKQAEKDVTIDPNEPTYCLCKQVSFGQMVMCDNDHCPIEWFHFTCVGITNTPKGKWYCPDCRKARSSTVKTKK